MCESYNNLSINELYTKLDTVHAATIVNKDYTEENAMYNCVKERLIKEDERLTQLINNYETNKLSAITASEMNNNTESLYKTDLYFTIGKSLLFVCLIITYFYFFRVTGILEPLKNGIKAVKDKADKLTDIKVPKMKLPELTMPTITMPKMETSPTPQIKTTNASK